MAALAIAWVCAVHATGSAATPIYSTSFDGLDSDYALTQQESLDNWSSNDPYIPATGAGQIDMVARLLGYSTPAETDLWAILGGLGTSDAAEISDRFVPGSFSVALWKPFSWLPLLAGNSDLNTIRLDVDFAITSSTVGRPERDAFSWNFGDIEGNAIFRLALEPASANPADGLSLSWYSSAGTRLRTPNRIAYDAIYQLQVDVSMADSSHDAFSVRLTDGFGVTSTILNNVSLPGGATASLAQIGTSWNILDPTADVNGDPAKYGDNAVVFNNFAIAVVPEPGSALLLAMAAALRLGRRHKRR